MTDFDKEIDALLRRTLAKIDVAERINAQDRNVLFAAAKARLCGVDEDTVHQIIKEEQRATDLATKVLIAAAEVTPGLDLGIKTILEAYELRDGVDAKSLAKALDKMPMAGGYAGDILRGRVEAAIAPDAGRNPRSRN